MKSSYLTVKETHNGNHSWDSDSDREEEPVSHSRQHLTPHQKSNFAMANHEQKNSEHKAITEDNDKTLSLQTCCVPLNTEKQITGLVHCSCCDNNLMLFTLMAASGVSNLRFYVELIIYMYR